MTDLTFIEGYLAALAACFVLSMGQFMLMDFEWFSSLTYHNKIFGRISLWIMVATAVIGLILCGLTPLVVYYY